MTTIRPISEEGHRLRQRTSLTLLTLVLVLLLAVGYSMAYLRHVLPKWAVPHSWDVKPTGAPETTGPPPEESPRQVLLNVYNGSDKKGMARKAAGELKRFGFKVDGVGNDPLNATLSGVGVVRFGPKGAEKAKTVLKYVKGTVAAPDARKSASVDLVIGPGFDLKYLGKDAQAPEQVVPTYVAPPEDVEDTTTPGATAPASLPTTTPAIPEQGVAPATPRSAKR